MKVAEIMGRGRKCALSALMLLAILAPCAQAALKYDVGGYVQDGLVLHLDGIRNVGANVPHDGSATVWANLAGGGGAMKTAYAGTGKNSSGTGRWLDNAFYMDADWYFKTIGVIPASESVTVEVFGDFTPTQPTTHPNFISVADGGSTTDCGIWMNGGALKWKLDSYGFSNSKRPTISSWDKQGFAAALDASQVVLYASGTTVSNTQTGRTSGKTFPACQWNIGCNYQAGNHPVKGTYYAVRIYTNTLTKAQIAANWQLDQYRFVTGIPVTNAVVATSLEGATGPEGVGAFAVDEDGYTFRAPACATVGGVAYALSGCNVASWDDATGNWGAAETRDGVFAVSVSSSDKVKITWQWEAATGSLDAGYLTEDLALRLDGIDNAGIGVHDASANVWKDLSGNGRDAFLAGNADGTSHWTDKGFYFNFNAVFSTAEKFAFGTQHTFEVLMDGKRSDWWGDTVEKDILVPSTGPAGAGGIYYKAANEILCHRSDATTGSAWNAMPGFYRLNTVTYLAALRDNAKTALITGTTYPETEYDIANGGIAASQNYVTNAWLVGSKNLVADPTTWLVGGRTTAPANTTKGTVKSVRLYNRLLTEAELARNRVVDEARFFGKIPATGCVVVQSAIDGLEGREPSGAYFPDGWTFSAGAGTQTVRGIKWQCAGYQLQTWDAATSTWGAQQTVLRNGENAVEYTAAATSAALPSVRLTWLWKPVSGIRTAADYALADYAVGGLQLHLDGIDNVGVGVHNDSATVWKDLSGNGRDATLTTGGASAWTKDGYSFAGDAYFRTSESFTLGTIYTMQMLVDWNSNNMDGQNRMFLAPQGGTADGAIWWKNQDENIFFRGDNSFGSAWNACPGISNPLTATYLTSLRNGNRAAITTGTTQPKTTGTKGKANSIIDWFEGTENNPASAGNWTVGADYQGNQKISAGVKSVRLYDRMLSEGELAWNRDVDSARFFGVLSTTNVVVVANEYSGLEDDTAYQVFGPTTFEAAVSGANFVRVKTLRQDGTWGDARSVEGASYAYDPATGGTVMIEFRKTNPFVIVVR